MPQAGWWFCAVSRVCPASTSSMTHLEGGVVEAQSLGQLRQEQGVVVGGRVALAVARAPSATPGATRLVGGDEAEQRLPGLRSPEVRDVQHAVAQPDDLRRPLLHPLVAAGAACRQRNSRRRAGPSARRRAAGCWPATTCTLWPSGSARSMNWSPPGASSGFRSGSSLRGQLGQVLQRPGAQTDHQEAWLAALGHMHEGRLAQAAHVEPIVASSVTLAPKSSSEGAHARQVWRSESHEGHVLDLDTGHRLSPKPGVPAGARSKNFGGAERPHGRQRAPARPSIGHPARRHADRDGSGPWMRRSSPRNRGSPGLSRTIASGSPQRAGVRRRPGRPRDRLARHAPAATKGAVFRGRRRRKGAGPPAEPEVRRKTARRRLKADSAGETARLAPPRAR